MMTTTAAPEGPAQVGADLSQKAREKGSGGGLGRYILVRFFLIIPTVFILVTMVFFLMHTIGDPITAQMGGRLSPDQLKPLIHAAGYDRPIYIQYFEYLGQLLTGNFGTTLTDNQKITDIVIGRGAATLELAFYSLIVAFAVGIPLGMLAAYLRDKWPDAVLRVMAILFYATPVFFAGLLLKLVFAVWLHVLPVNGRASASTQIDLQLLDHPTNIYLIDAFRTGNINNVFDVLQHAILPGIALGLLTAGIFLRLVRLNVIGTLGQDYIESARSRGVKELRLVRKHAYRPALVPIITVIGLQIAVLLGGAVLTETTFGWYGLGLTLVGYIQARDFVAVQGIVAVLAVIVAVTNFIVDIIAALIDPRVRY